MPADILLTVIATTIIQSVFGVGVLVFGTPILLLLGYDFINALRFCCLFQLPLIHCKSSSIIRV